MNAILHSIAESLHHPPRLHALAVHLPIALGMLGLVALLAHVLTLGNSRVLRRACVLIYLIAAGLSYWAYTTGEAAEEYLGEAGAALTTEAVEELDTHRAMGEYVWIFFLGTAVATGLTGLRHRGL